MGAEMYTVRSLSQESSARLSRAHAGRGKGSSQLFLNPLQLPYFKLSIKESHNNTVTNISETHVSHAKIQISIQNAKQFQWKITSSSFIRFKSVLPPL